MTDPRIDTGLFRDLLARTGISFRELAAEVGVSHTTVGRWATGEARPSVAQVKAVVRMVAGEPDRLRERAVELQHLVGLLTRSLDDYERVVERLAGIGGRSYDADAA